MLERVSGPLADVLTGGTGAEAVLQRLEDQNAFVTALDAGRTWFRYHHLFADLLRLELRRVAPATIPSLHRAAAAWHEKEDDVVEGVRHYQAAGDWAPAGRLLLDNYFTLTMAGRHGNRKPADTETAKLEIARLRHIYAKLDAHTRSEAVARARELGLVAPGAVRR